MEKSLFVGRDGSGNCRKHVGRRDASGGGGVGLGGGGFQLQAPREAGGENAVEGVPGAGGVNGRAEGGGGKTHARRADEAAFGPEGDDDFGKVAQPFGLKGVWGRQPDEAPEFVGQRT